MEYLLKLILKNRNRCKNISKFLLQLIYNIDLPKTVYIGENLTLAHNSPGLVIHPNTNIGNNVKLYQGVTIGRADIYREISDSKFEKIVIEDDVVVCAGANVLCKEGVLSLGKGSVVAANAVLTCSTGPKEIWAGIPAKKIGERKN